MTNKAITSLSTEDLDTVTGGRVLARSALYPFGYGYGYGSLPLLMALNNPLTNPLNTAAIQNKQFSDFAQAVVLAKLVQQA